MLQWVTQLGLRYFRGIYSRDNLPDKIHRLETGIINLDDSTGGGSHWICYRNVDKQYCEYFDPFGLIMPNDFKKYLKTSGKKVVYSSDEIQERDSVLCDYWCLYYFLERQKAKCNPCIADHFAVHCELHLQKPRFGKKVVKFPQVTVH